MAFARDKDKDKEEEVDDSLGDIELTDFAQVEKENRQNLQLQQSIRDNLMTMLASFLFGNDLVYAIFMAVKQNKSIEYMSKLCEEYIEPKNTLLLSFFTHSQEHKEEVILICRTMANYSILKKYNKAITLTQMIILQQKIDAITLLTAVMMEYSRENLNTILRYEAYSLLIKIIKTSDVDDSLQKVISYALKEKIMKDDTESYVWTYDPTYEIFGTIANTDPSPKPKYNDPITIYDVLRICIDSLKTNPIQLLNSLIKQPNPKEFKTNSLAAENMQVTQIKISIK